MIDDLTLIEARSFVTDELHASDGTYTLTSLFIRVKEKFPELSDTDANYIVVAGQDDYFQEIDHGNFDL